MECHNCGGPITRDLTYCLTCHDAVHNCANCVFRDDVRCRRVRGLLGPMGGRVANDCQEWQPGRTTLTRPANGLRARLAHANVTPCFRT